jgi:hypothetical protein
MGFWRSSEELVKHFLQDAELSFSNPQRLTAAAPSGLFDPFGSTLRFSSALHRSWSVNSAL